MSKTMILSKGPAGRRPGGGSHMHLGLWSPGHVMHCMSWRPRAPESPKRTCSRLHAIYSALQIAPRHTVIYE